MGLWLGRGAHLKLVELSFERSDILENLQTATKEVQRRELVFGPPFHISSLEDSSTNSVLAKTTIVFFFFFSLFKVDLFIFLKVDQLFFKVDQNLYFEVDFFHHKVPNRVKPGVIKHGKKKRESESCLFLSLFLPFSFLFTRGMCKEGGKIFGVDSKKNSLG